MLFDCEHTVIGTAGHIDHGKTALIRALTGYDCDTLAEEKKRGITIELGFAFLEFPDLDRLIVFIDCPGHEKLVKTMVAGASNLDGVLLVVAADEGINVQTLEHFEILRLLDIPQGVIALTKTDLVDADRVSAVTADIRALTAGSFLADAPIVPVSAVTGEGVGDVRSALHEVVRSARKRSDSGIFRMPIDRVFTIQGFGTVIAGTILSGEARVGDKLEILPDGLSTRIRGIQLHATSVQSSGLGKRTAVNLADIKKEHLRRGQCACAPGAVKPTTRLDTRLSVLNSYSEDLKNRTRVRFHVGADEVMARLVLLDSEKVSPGQTALAQFILESPTVALPKDRFVIRAFSSLATIGGGAVLDAQPVAHKRFDEATLDSLEKRQGGMADVVEQAFAKSGSAPLGLVEIVNAVGESEAEVTVAIDELLESGRIVRVFPRTVDAGSRDVRKETCLHKSAYEVLSSKLTSIIADYYTRNPYRTYMPGADLQSRFTKLATKQVYEAIAVDLYKSGKLTAQGTKVGLAGREAQYKPGEGELAGRIERMYESAGFAAPSEDEVIEQLRVPADAFENIMTALTDQRRLVRMGEKVTYHEKHIKQAKKVVTDYISAHGGITAAELRDLIGLSRKYSIAILEYFDNAQVTKRLGDKRVLR